MFCEACDSVHNYGKCPVLDEYIDDSDGIDSDELEIYEADQ